MCYSVVGSTKVRGKRRSPERDVGGGGTGGAEGRAEARVKGEAVKVARASVKGKEKVVQIGKQIILYSTAAARTLALRFEYGCGGWGVRIHPPSVQAAPRLKTHHRLHAKLTKTLLPAGRHATNHYVLLWLVSFAS